MSVGRIFSSLLGLAIMAVPFNGLPFLKNVFGELAVEGAFYIILIALIGRLIYLFMNNGKIYLPRDASFYMMLLLLVWIVISGLCNLPSIISAETKGRTGLEKFVFQIVVFLFMLATALLFYNVFRTKDDILLVIRRYILYSFIIAGIYSFFEIGALFNNELALNFLHYLDVMIRSTDNYNLDIYYGRLRSVCAEASWFGMYSSFILPWMLSYLFTEENKAKYLLLNGYLIFMIFLTQSRTAYFITLLQLIFFSWIFWKDVVKRKSLLVYVLAAFTVGIPVFYYSIDYINLDVTEVFLSFIYGGTKYELSNIARLGSQAAALSMFMDNPIKGVGLGQYGFYMTDYVPYWAYASEEIRLWVNNAVDTPWPPVHGLYARLLAELGLFGFLIWAVAWFCIIKKLIAVPRERLMVKVLLVSIFGVLLVGFNGDSLRFFGYWILMGVSWCVNEKNAKER